MSPCAHARPCTYAPIRPCALYNRRVTSELWTITWFSVATALAATVLMVPPGLALGWVLARRRFAGKTLVETLVSLPLVLPPVATGYVLLRLLGRRSPIGRWLEDGGLDVLFTWKAVVLAMTVMGFPLFVRTVRAGFEQINERFEQVAATLGASVSRIFFSVSLPLARRFVLAGAILGFSRALGEFGATVMVAGSMPGRTRTLAVSLYTFAETGQDREAATILVIVTCLAFVAVWVSNRLAAS
jgi:molybdate transport system permease protein